MTSSHKKENGNIVISYDKVKVSNRLIIIIIPELMLLWFLISIFNGVKELNPSEHYEGAFLIAFFFTGSLLFYFLHSMFIQRANKKKEKKLIFQNLNPIIKQDILNMKNDIVELDRTYIKNDTNDEIKREVNLILSNGLEITYEIINIAEYSNKTVLEIHTQYKVKEKKTAANNV